MIFDLELYSFLIITILAIDYYVKYRKSFEIDSYIGVAYIFSVVFFLLINIAMYTIPALSNLGKFIVCFSYMYSFLPPAILYIYTKRNYSDSVVNIKIEVKKMLIYSFFYLLLVVLYLNQHFNNILNVFNTNFSFESHDYILSLSLIPLLCLTFKMIFRTCFKNEEVTYKLFIVSLITTIFIVLNFFTSFIMLGTIIYTICALLICLNKYDKSIYRDSLTGLYNKRKLNQYILANTNSHKLRAVYVIDMDKFKLINDTYGHTMGDSILRNAASIIKKSIKTSDFAVRYGGDEFIIIAELNSANELDHIENKLYKNIKLYNKKTDIPISLSIGGSLWKEGNDFSEIIEQSDSKMYKNKYDKLS